MISLRSAAAKKLLPYKHTAFVMNDDTIYYPEQQSPFEYLKYHEDQEDEFEDEADQPEQVFDENEDQHNFADDFEKFHFVMTCKKEGLFYSNFSFQFVAKRILDRS